MKTAEALGTKLETGKRILPEKKRTQIIIYNEFSKQK